MNTGAHGFQLTLVCHDLHISLFEQPWGSTQGRDLYYQSHRRVKECCQQVTVASECPV